LQRFGKLELTLLKLLAQLGNRLRFSRYRRFHLRAARF
jgi:hypothetical protein